MIYPSTTGKADGKEIRLRGLESVWIQGKLKMWGRWSHVRIAGDAAGNMFHRLLANQKVTKTTIEQTLRRLGKAGVSKSELADYFCELMVRHKSRLAFCTDSEALLIDRVVGEVLADFPGLIRLLHQRYKGRGESLRAIAESLHESHPEISISTCRRRIEMQLSLAESMLYLPMNAAFERDPGRFAIRLQSASKPT
jgi:hypothetical protein